ncbi:trypsin-like serine protease [Geomonas sp. Red69]|uniref:S1 family peptidase n=1 Tax=Geomonas diazotrophica TaxID=2843197 RepID=UPI001C121FDC|nr:trypsin-like serine protease [Geomonas diazotrophica]MBU5637912.1 trypsin-like serine protease [Geomonas diazotrophica]
MMVKLNLTVVCCVLLLLFLPGRASAIVGGTQVSLEDVFSRHLVGIINPATDGVCTGVLIAPDVALTAAHCFDASRTPSDFVVVFGRDLIPGRGGVALDVAAIRIPPAYDPEQNRSNSSFDLALVRLSGPAPLGYVPAAIASEPDHFIDGKANYIAAGYGVSTYQGNDPGVLRKLEVAPSKLLAKGKLIELHDLRAGPCSGDSGSPLFRVALSDGKARYAVIGIQSQAVQRAEGGKFNHKICEDIGLYTSLAPYRGWIEENILFRDAPQR